MRTETTDKTPPKTTSIAFIPDRPELRQPHAEAVPAGSKEFLPVLPTVEEVLREEDEREG